jgi:large subunit ribosomal protein L21
MSYAIIKTGGKQYKVSQGASIDVEKLDLEVGSDATFDSVLMLSNEGQVKVGNPTISGATVTAEVVDQYRAKKVTAFKFKRRKGYHKTKGHRQHLTRLTIKEISA